MSWDDGFPGARASRPHQAWHSLGHLPHWVQPGTAPWLSFGLTDAVPADRVAACSTARKLSRGQRDRMRAGRPRSQAMPWGGVPGGRLLRKPAGALWETPVCPRVQPPPPHDGVDHSRVKQPAFMAFREQGPCPVKPVCDSNVFVVHPCPWSCPSSRDPQLDFSAKPQMWGLTTGSGARNPSHCTWQKPEPAINGKVSRSGRQPSRILCHTGWRMC